MKSHTGVARKKRIQVVRGTLPAHIDLSKYWRTDELKGSKLMKTIPKIKVGIEKTNAAIKRLSSDFCSLRARISVRSSIVGCCTVLTLRDASTDVIAEMIVRIVKEGNMGVYVSFISG